MNKSELFYTAVYIRLSREDGDKEESDSVGNQKKLLTNYVSKMENIIIYDVYVDDGYTGTSFDRPSFKRMIADIEDGKVRIYPDLGGIILTRGVIWSGYFQN